MTINHFADKTDINIYFHMKNHYKKIRNVKSTIDNSAPQGFIKSVSTPPNSVRSWKTCTFEESHVRRCSRVPRHNPAAKMHNYSAESKSDTELRSISLPPRPTTRRHPYEMPHKLQCKSRSQSTVQTSRKDGLVRFNVKKKKSNVLIKRNRIQTEASAVQKNVNIMYVNENMLDNEDSTRSSQSKRKKSGESSESVNQSRSALKLEEHEYLHFLLKITEDIILNNFYTNEDIEKVFQAHVEANKDHLKMEKMEAQLARLCVELNIPYKFSENELENKECYQKFFENHCLIPKEQGLTDCECTTIRALEIDNKQLDKLDDIFETEQLNISELENKILNTFTALTNKCSLGRVSECTEPTNSVETLVNQTEQPSLMTVSSFGNIDILPCFENMENSDQHTKEASKLEEHPEESLASQLFSKDPHLTDKEKFTCFEEDILFHKLKYDANESDKLNDFLDPNSENILTKSEDGGEMEDINLEKIPYIANIQGDCSEINLFHEIEDPLKYLDNVGNYLNENLTQVNNELEYDNETLQTKETAMEIKKENVTELKSTLDIHDSSQIMNEGINAIEMGASLDVHDGVQIMNEKNAIETKLSSDVHETIQMDEPISQAKEEIKIMYENLPEDKHTEIIISSCDKERIASPKLKNYSKDKEYVLINGPVYVLKSVLNSEEELILYDKPRDVKSNSFKEISPEKLIGESTIPFNCFEPMSVIKPISEFDYVSFYLRKNNCTKLLNSDYDLTPQRDNNMSDKYHHLLVDATTSISNMHLTELMDKTNITHEKLLLTDKYALNNKNEYEKSIEPENQTEIEDRSEQSNYIFSNNETSVDGQYEIKSYSLPKEINGSVMLSGYSVSSQAEHSMQGSDQEVEVGIPLDGYEINTEIATVSKGNGKVAGTIGSSKMDDNVESNVSTDTETSQSQSVRSKGKRRSSGLCTNQKHILGKRKLEHPP